MLLSTKTTVYIKSALELQINKFTVKWIEPDVFYIINQKEKKLL